MRRGDTAHFLSYIFITIIVFSPSSLYSTAIWEGDVDNNMSDTSNWSSNPASDTWEFDGTATTSTPNMDSALSSSAIIFKSGAASFTISGGSVITLSGKILNEDNDVQTIDAPISLTNTGHDFDAKTEDISLGGVISGLGNIIYKTSASKSIILQGNNTFSGGSDVQGGANVKIEHDNALGTGAITINSGNLYMNTDGLNASNTITNSNSGSIVGGLHTSGSSTFSGNIGIGGGNIQFSQASGGTLNLDGVISGGSNVTKIGDGVVTYKGVNTYTGSTTISAGTLRLEAAGVVTDTSDVSVAASATFDLNNKNETIGDLTGSGNVTTGGGNLTINANGTNTFSGVISEGGELIKSGSGTTKLTGTNTYTGTTKIHNGTLTIGVNAPHGSSGALGNDTADVELGNTSGSDAATFEIDTAGVTMGRKIDVKSGSTGTKTISASHGSGTSTLSNDIKLNSDLTVTAASGATMDITGVVSLSNNLTKTGAGTVILSGVNTNDGNITVSAGTVLVDGSVDSSSATIVSSGATVGGTGTVNGTMTVNTGGIITGGAYNSIGNLTLANATNTLNTGSTIYVEFNDAGGPSGTYDGTAGTHWDLITFSSLHTLSDTSADPIVIKIRNETAGFFNSLEGLPSFADSPNYAGTGTDFKIVDNVTGYNASYFTLDSDILNLNWRLTHDSNALWLSFEAVPEPSTYVMCGLLGFCVLFKVYKVRSRKKGTEV